MTEESLNSLDGGGLFPRLQQRYSLRANPLEMETPFFPDAMRHHALEALRHLCGFGDMALLLTGAAGSGKPEYWRSWSAANHPDSTFAVYRRQR